MSKFVFHAQNLVYCSQNLAPLPPKYDTSSFGTYNPCLDTYLLPAAIPTSTPTSYQQRCLPPTSSDAYFLPAAMPVYVSKQKTCPNRCTFCRVISFCQQRLLVKAVNRAKDNSLEAPGGDFASRPVEKQGAHRGVPKCQSTAFVGYIEPTSRGVYT
ncbi:hypothetical protein P167DRAFT_550522 [Morchella conica CCBAS932]|uniref:Uncharacterized protein n=1 Tax=Morchella conica CCBAS932 TaxID=1392247 RepID=A0A3N4K7B6_9PEZI|nr:hypothetical protein P167DRAFT_550522 [Morchella conica CCBAS932]